MNWVSCASFTPDDLSHGPGCLIRHHDVWCLLDHNELAWLDAEEQRRWLAVSRSWLPVRGLQSCWTDRDVLCPLSVSRLFWNTHHSVAGGSSGISRQSVDIRLQVSGAIPTKQGNRSLFTDKVVEQQDSQDQRLKAGYSLRDGVSSYVIDVSVAQQAETQMTVAEPSAVKPLRCSRQPSSKCQLTRQLMDSCLFTDNCRRLRTKAGRFRLVSWLECSANPIHRCMDGDL